MAFIIDHITSLDVSKLNAGEVRQCLLYLDYASKRYPEMETKIAHTRENLNKRVQKLRQAKKDAGARHTT
jgi:hypothetical protein